MGHHAIIVVASIFLSGALCSCDDGRRGNSGPVAKPSDAQSSDSTQPTSTRPSAAALAGASQPSMGTPLRDHTPTSQPAPTANSDTFVLTTTETVTFEWTEDEVTFDGHFGKEAAITVSASASKATTISPFAAQVRSADKRIVKIFLGLPFVADSLMTDRSMEIHNPPRITLLGGAQCLDWGRKPVVPEPGKYQFEFFAALNDKPLLPLSSTKFAWGVEDQYAGGDVRVAVRSFEQSTEIGRFSPSAVIVPSASSRVPVRCDGSGLPKAIVPNALGTVWALEKSGTTIHVGQQILTATKDGAEVRFTSNGVVLDGVDQRAIEGRR